MRCGSRARPWAARASPVPSLRLWVNPELGPGLGQMAPLYGAQAGVEGDEAPARARRSHGPRSPRAGAGALSTAMLEKSHSTVSVRLQLNAPAGDGRAKEGSYRTPPRALAASRKSTCTLLKKETQARTGASAKRSHAQCRPRGVQAAGHLARAVRAGTQRC